MCYMFCGRACTCIVNGSCFIRVCVGVCMCVCGGGGGGGGGATIIYSRNFLKAKNET